MNNQPKFPKNGKHSKIWEKLPEVLRWLTETYGAYEKWKLHTVPFERGANEDFNRAVEQKALEYSANAGGIKQLINYAARIKHGFNANVYYARGEADKMEQYIPAAVEAGFLSAETVLNIRMVDRPAPKFKLTPRMKKVLDQVREREAD